MKPESFIGKASFPAADTQTSRSRRGASGKTGALKDALAAVPLTFLSEIDDNSRFG